MNSVNKITSLSTGSIYLKAEFSSHPPLFPLLVRFSELLHDTYE